MRASTVFAAGVIMSSVITVKVIEFLDENDFGAEPTTVAARAPETGAAASLAPPSRFDGAVRPTSASYRHAHRVRIAASRDHQFYIDVDINRRASPFLVDTGASHVAMRDSDARTAGIYTKRSDYQYTIRTANGETKAARVRIKNVEIGGIRVKEVDAFVLPDDKLSVNLLGMSFLSRIESVEARAGELILKG